MALLKCKMCGGSLEVAAGETIIECEYCGTQQTLPKTTDENIQALFNRANLLRQKNEFDKAETVYEKILEADDTEAEAYWGVILCKFGIEYVEDPKTYKRIPTCHRTSYDSIVADEYYKKALENADITQRSIYEAEAKKIDEIQKGILAISAQEEPYDVFICYKETDESGKRTQDSVIANDIYYQLTQEGFKVFYAAITLEDKLGSAYEPIIFAALNSSKVMLSIGTKPEYFSAVWVKNEWSRFLKMMKNDRSKMLIPCYKGMDAYELPEEFAHLQAQDMGKIGFINDIVRGIKKVIVKEEPKQNTIVKETVVTSTTNTTVAPLLKRAFMFLEDGEFAKADDFCEQVLNLDPENAEAYLGKLMAGLLVKKKENLKDQAEPFDSGFYYQKAIRFADNDLKNELNGYISHIKTRNENARLNKIYNRAKSNMSAADTEDAYKEAGKLFTTIIKYQDSSALAQECFKLGEQCRKNVIYDNAMKKASISTVESVSKAIDLLNSISGWKDADEQVAKCEAMLPELRAKEENERIEAAKRAKKNKKIAIITTPIVCAFIAFMIILGTVIIPNSNYNTAISLIEEGDVVKAYEILISLDGYKDSESKAASIYDQYKIEKIKAAKVGDIVTFGKYEQDNKTSNGKEKIEWIVLEIKDGRALVISKDALDARSFGGYTWEKSGVRRWLNSDFIQSAFSNSEISMIPTVTVTADKHPEENTDPGNDTQDKVFLLSYNEIVKYFNSRSARKCQLTDYARAQGGYDIIEHNPQQTGYAGNTKWWTRTPGAGYDNYDITFIYWDGDIFEIGSAYSDDDHTIRPAMWIEVE